MQTVIIALNTEEGSIAWNLGFLPTLYTMYSSLNQTQTTTKCPPSYEQLRHGSN